MSDLTVKRRSAEMLEISSWRTRGTCAIAIIQQISPSHPIIIPQLRPAYMNGITLEEIDEAIGDFLYFEDKYRFS